MSANTQTDGGRDGSSANTATATTTATTFTTAAAAVATVAPAVAVVATLLGSPTAAFRGSLVASAVVGVVFAGHHLRQVRAGGRPRLPAAFVTTVFGLWFMTAPVLYSGVGFLATAGVQFAGLLTAAFAGYNTVEAIEDLAGGRA